MRRIFWLMACLMAALATACAAIYGVKDVPIPGEAGSADDGPGDDGRAAEAATDGAGPGDTGGADASMGSDGPGVDGSSDTGTDTRGEKDSGTDSKSEGGGKDAHTDAPTDAPSDGPVTITYHDVTDMGFWTTYDLANVSGALTGFRGAIFDGTFVYFIPYDNGAPSGIVARYDTTKTFASTGAWSKFDLTGIDKGATNYFGGAFDGRYVYFAPYGTGMTSPLQSGKAARFDTQGTFGDRKSWEVFDITAVDTTGRGFAGAYYDGKQYVYYVGFNGDNDAQGGAATFARYDTKGAGFKSSSAWKVYGAGLGFGVSAAVSYYAGGVEVNGVDFFGTYYEYQPSYNPSLPFNSADGGGWTWTNQLALGAGIGNFGVVTDGRYVYTVPFFVEGTPVSLASRYDSTGAIANQTSWKSFDLSNLDGQGKCFAGGGFDGRYVYYMPNGADSPATASLMVRYDTTTDAFDVGGSWEKVDVALVTTVPAAAGFFGSAFDGEYLYLVPNGGTVIARFDARTPKKPLSASVYRGSFL